MPPRTRAGTKQIFLKAIKENNLREVRDWIDTVDINMIDENTHYTPLIIAAKSGYKDIVELLLSKNANTNNKSYDGNTALTLAAFYNHAEIAQMLIDAGSDINSENLNKDTPLILAANKGHIELVKWLIDAGADVNKTNISRNNALIYAVFNNSTDIVKYLIAAGADVNLKTKNNSTALLTALSTNNTEIFKVLIEAGADVNVMNTYGESVLVLSINYSSNSEIVKMLVDAGADVNLKNNYGKTPLVYALSRGDPKIVKMLIDAGVDINSKDNNGDTPLISATWFGNTEIVKLLLEAGADVNIKNSKGLTALFLAANPRRDSTNIVKLLLEKNPELTDQIKNGIKRKSFKPEILELLAAHYKDILKPVIWKGQTRGNIEKFDTLFANEESMRNWSFCPICLGWIPRADGCMYMTHNCTTMPYYHEELYEKYRNRDGLINWCTICGRICAGHYHYPLVEANAQKPEPLIFAQTNPFETDCRISNGGGGLPEKIARIRQLRETALRLQNEVGKINVEEAKNKLVEDAWNAALRPENQKIRNIVATKTWNIPAANFPADVVANTVANVIANANDPSKYSAPIVLSPGVGAAAEGRNAGYEYNSVSFADDIPLIVFKHKDKDGNERLHPQIGKDSLLADLMTSEKRGKCFDADCGGFLYPREIQLAFADPKLAPTVTEEDRAKVAKYKEWFNKWRAEDAKTGGRRRRRQTKRRRNGVKRTTRRQTRK